jgi:ribonucleoside-diphosphate reductase alpha chain
VAAAATTKAKAAQPSEKPVAVEPLTPGELKEMLAKSKENEDDDCLMCGS